jgi:hypothetical protein
MKPDEELERLTKSELIERIQAIKSQTPSGKEAAACLRTLSRLSLAVLIITIPLRYRWILLDRPNPPIYLEYTDVLLFISDLFLSLILIFWLVSLAVEPRRLNLGPVFITFPIIGLLGFGFLSIVFSSIPYLSLYHSLRFFLLTLIYLYLINERPSLNWFVIPLSILVVFQSTVGVTQVLNQASIGLSKLGELPLDPTLSGISIVFERGIRSLRAYGLTDHPNILGGSLTFQCYSLHPGMRRIHIHGNN